MTTTKHKLGDLYSDHLNQALARWAVGLERAGYAGAAVFAGVGQMIFRDDQTYPFKANAMFLGLVPLTHAPGSVVLIEPGRRPTLLFLSPDDYWHEPPDAPTGYWPGSFEIKQVATEDDLRQALPGDLSNWVSIDPAGNNSLGFGAVNDPTLLTFLDYHRAYKTPYEVVCTEQASHIGAQAHRAARSAFLSGASEYDIHQIYCQAAGLTEEELPYASIVALAPHGAVLHYQKRERDVVDAPAFLIDAGGSFLGYASDITRTWTTNDDFQALIDSVDAMQQDICNKAKPGVDFAELHRETHRQIAGILAGHGMLTTNAEDAFDQGVTEAFLPHGLGHLLGLQVHDMGGHQIDEAGTRREPPAEYPWLRLTRELEAGMVLTIEPGVYFIESLLEGLRDNGRGSLLNWDRIKAFMPFGGIRIEDNVLITDDGHRNLTREAFAALEA